MTERHIKLAIITLLDSLDSFDEVVFPEIVVEACDNLKSEFSNYDYLIQNAKSILSVSAKKNIGKLNSIFNILDADTKEKEYVTKESPNSYIEKFLSEAEELFLGRDVYDEFFLKNLIGIMEEYMGQISCFDDSNDYIPIYDFQKLKTAIVLCIDSYMMEAGRYDEEEKAFLLFEFDLSGIQKFIYTITSKDALKMLRVRSFFLEILMDDLVDSLLEEFDLSRINLLYAGGGHCYMLLPNISEAKTIIDEVDDRFNRWLLKEYDISLYLAAAYVNVSALVLKNVPEGAYDSMFIELGDSLNARKMHRYSAETVTDLINNSKSHGMKACKVCNKLFSDASEIELCDTCDALKSISGDILKDDAVFAIVKDESNKSGIRLSNDRRLISCTLSAVDDVPGLIRFYYNSETKKHYANGIKIMVGNYSPREKTTLEELAQTSKGIKRLGVLRADVDNLGNTFTNRITYNSILKTAILSRNLSLFFKSRINKLLEGTNTAVVYSGGDDLFLVGAWNEIIDAGIKIRNAFSEYTCEKLSLSAGIGIYNSKYPINRIAEDTGEYEDRSKLYPNKNAVTIMDETYSWDDFDKKVIKEKRDELERFFSTQEDRGMSFMYNLLELIRNAEDKINLARYAYVLARLEPTVKEEQESYGIFKSNMHKWIQNSEDRRQLQTAMCIYSYMSRERSDE